MGGCEHDDATVSEPLVLLGVDVKLGICERKEKSISGRGDLHWGVSWRR